MRPTRAATLVRYYDATNNIKLLLDEMVACDYDFDAEYRNPYQLLSELYDYIAREEEK